MTLESLERSEVTQVREDVSYRRLFTLKSFPQLASATVLARVGAQFWQVSMLLFVLETYHSPALAGLATFLAIVPGLLVSPVAGALLDRHGRLRLILVDYAVAAASMALIASLALFHLLSPGLLLVIVAFSSLTSPLSASGTRTLFPLVVPRELWDRANAVDSGSQALATVIGPALAGFCVAWFGGPGAFLVTAGVFIVAGVALFGVPEPLTEHSQQASLLRSAAQSLVYVIRHPTLRGVIFTLWMANVPFGILTVALPVLAFRSFQWGADAVGGLWSVAGVATILAGVVVGRINTEGRERRIIGIGLAFSALGCVLALMQSPVAILAAMALFGLSSGPIDIGLFALRQRRTDPRWFGRVFAVSMSLNFAGMPVGSAIAGPVLERSVSFAFILAAAIAVLGCVVPFLTIPNNE